MEELVELRKLNVRHLVDENLFLQTFEVLFCTFWLDILGKSNV